MYVITATSTVNLPIIFCIDDDASVITSGQCTNCNMCAMECVNASRSMLGTAT